MISKISNFTIVNGTDKFFIEEISGVDNLPEKGPYLIAANHSSYFDHFLILTLIKKLKGQNVHFITKQEAFDSYFSKKWHLAMGAIPLNRSTSDTGAIKTILKQLKADKIVCIYPEGTRSPTGTMYEGKEGAVRIANMANVPIIPIGIIGAFDILPKKRLVPNLIKAKINIGKPIEVNRKEGKDVFNKKHHELMDEITQLSGNNRELRSIPMNQKGMIDEWLRFAYESNERGIRNYPGDPSPNILHKRSLYYCNEILEKDDKNHLAYFEKSRALGRIGINSRLLTKKLIFLYQAKLHLKSCIEQRPDFAPGYYALAVWYMEVPKTFGGNKKRALYYYSKAASLNPKEIYIQIGLAKCFLELEKNSEAQLILRYIVEALKAETSVDQRRKLEALTLLMRQDESYVLNERMIDKCLINSQIG